MADSPTPNSNLKRNALRLGGIYIFLMSVAFSLAVVNGDTPSQLRVGLIYIGIGAVVVALIVWGVSRRR